nr:hypothetical protein Itr_chr14CG25580 [Ipomoea trifida]
MERICSVICFFPCMKFDCSMCRRLSLTKCYFDLSFQGMDFNSSLLHLPLPFFD